MLFDWCRVFFKANKTSSQTWILFFGTISSKNVSERFLILTAQQAFVASCSVWTSSERRKHLDFPTQILLSSKDIRTQRSKSPPLNDVQAVCLLRTHKKKNKYPNSVWTGIPPSTTYNYVYTQHMHYLHKFHKHSIVPPSYYPRLCSAHASQATLSTSCAMRLLFPPFSNSPLIPAVLLQWCVARCIIPFSKRPFLQPWPPSFRV